MRNEPLTPAELEAAKAAFLAKGNTVTTAPAGIAYGVDREADKAKRAEARQRYDTAWNFDESAHERRAEAIREAYHTGGRHAAIDAMNEG